MSLSMEADAAWLEGKESASTDSGQKYHCSQQNALARGQMGPAQLFPQWGARSEWVKQEKKKKISTLPE